MVTEATSAIQYSLPTEHSPPIGRDIEIAALRVLLHDQTTPLVTLTGPGGTGKTTLALHLGRLSIDHFPDGVFFVDLTPLAQPEQIPGHIAYTAGLEEEAGLPLVILLSKHFAPRRALLILDNFEHLIEGVGVVSELLRACPRLCVLATSREPLRLRHERLYPLSPLALPSPEQAADPETLAGVAAVALFVRQARAVHPEFELTTENIAYIAQIVTRLDGLPLAVELAAARTHLFAPAALLARLEGSPLGILAGGPRDQPTRQQTLRATISWSVDLLPPAETRLFRRLAVLVNGFTLDAAESVAVNTYAGDDFGDHDVLEGLESLLLKNLILRVSGDDALEPRFGLLETIRAYSLEQLRAVGEEKTAQQAHFDFYLALAENAVPHFLGPQHAVWLKRLAADENNLRAALEWALGEAQSGGLSEPAVRLAGALGNYWNYGNRFQEGLSWLDQVLTLIPAPATRPGPAPDADRPALLYYARAVSAAGTMAWRMGDFLHAKTLHEMAMALYSDAGDEYNMANSRHNLAVQLVHLGDIRAANELNLQNAAYYEQAQDPIGLANSYANLTVSHGLLGDDQSAIQFGEMAMSVARRENLGMFVAMILNNLGQAYLRLGELARAEACFQESEHIAFTQGFGYLNIDRELAWGRLREAQGDTVAAAEANRRALREADKTGSREDVANGLEQMAFCLHRQGDPARGARLLGAAAALRARMGAPDVRDQPVYYNSSLPHVRAALGDEQFAAEWNAGSQLSRAAAVALALDESIDGGRQTTDDRRMPVDPLAALTPREREVALLMARGRSNEQIAAELFITLKTVEKHAGNALGKLGFRNRVELAAWAGGQIANDE